MDQYLIHYDREKNEIQLRVQHSIALGFCNIKEAIEIEPTTIPNSTTRKDEWLVWHNDWKQYFIKKYRLNPEYVQ